VAQHPRINWGFRTQAPENHLKLIASGATQLEAEEALQAADVAVRAVLGDHIFGVDDERFAAIIGKMLRAAKATVSVAESCTGGLLSEQLTHEPGSSDFFAGGAVAYSNALKERWAQVPAEQISQYGAVSAEVAESLARGIRVATGATYGLGVTGIAGPSGGSETKPVGTVFIALATPKATSHRRFTFPGDRELIRAFSAYGAMDMLRRELLKGSL